MIKAQEPAICRTKLDHTIKVAEIADPDLRATAEKIDAQDGMRQGEIDYQGAIQYMDSISFRVGRSHYRWPWNDGHYDRADILRQQSLNKGIEQLDAFEDALARGERCHRPQVNPNHGEAMRWLEDMPPAK